MIAVPAPSSGTGSGEGDATELAAQLLRGLARVDRPLGALTTYRVGGRAALFAEPATAVELARLGEAVRASGVAVLVLGKGSNMLVSDRGFPGLCIRLAESFASIEISGPTLRAGGAAAYPVVARRSAAAGLSGMEWAVGIPGSVGGAVRMNAGGHGAETADRLVSCRIVDLASGSDRLVERAELDLAYRHSSVRDTEVVVDADFVLELGSAEAANRRIAEIVRWRRENQPGGQNAGSVFTNPPGDSAGRLVEAAGLKGFRVGSAEVSGKHANFIQCDPGGSAEHVRELIVTVQRLVAERLGVELTTELRLVGFEEES